ncbi:tRNA pseudouridine(55) synthase TruB [Desulfitobacterium metallireducens]|uniref:tRNA pseudouridine synthase B n=1 Tax=Desulfitobacterium metallireducens DSM 15288 TaxID=871968 RepID=W0EE76_9FIRM|nr:tRNA pseudouridine(55) synthase TruB [Desulfitobacterium metallireducens]AHF07514.1 tRNA pseudouridine synthase B [Desulfitobacterium metallireducens DSM 15288]
MDGVINVHKPVGMTSSDVVVWVRKHLNTRKVGHTGTLDPEVNGVLPICVGRATRLAEYLTDQGKSYRAEITFGIVTDTQDAQGEILHSIPPEVNGDDFLKILPQFLGSIQQIPPMYSAVRHQGKHLYDLARQGIEVVRASRTINIRRLEFISWQESDYPKAVFEVDCSKGTYIRTLCQDIGDAMGCGAHMSKLVRLRSGPFRVEESWTLEQLSESIEQGRDDFLIPFNRVLDLPRIVLTPERAEAFRHGLSTSQRGLSGSTLPESGQVQVFMENEFIGIGKCNDQSLYPYKVFF